MEAGGLPGRDFNRQLPRQTLRALLLQLTGTASLPVYKVFREPSGDGVTHRPPFTCSLSLSLPSEQNPPPPASPAFTVTQSKKQEQKVRADAISRQNLFSHWTCGVAETESRNLMTKRPLGGERHPESLYLGDTSKMSSKNAPDVWPGGECSQQTQGSQAGCSSWADSALKGNVVTAGDTVGCHNSGRQGEGGCFWHLGPVMLLTNLQCKGQPPPPQQRTLQSQRQQHRGWEMLPQINHIPVATSRNPNHPIWNKYLPSLWPSSYPVTQVFLSCVCVCMCVCVCVISCSVVSNSLRPHGLQPARFLCPWDSPGKNTKAGSHSLLQGIFPTQGSNLGLLHGSRILY